MFTIMDERMFFVSSDTDMFFNIHNHEIKQHIEYDHIFGDEEQQVQAGQYLHHLLTIRADLMEEDPALEAGP